MSDREEDPRKEGFTLKTYIALFMYSMAGLYGIYRIISNIYYFGHPLPKDVDDMEAFQRKRQKEREYLEWEYERDRKRQGQHPSDPESLSSLVIQKPHCTEQLESEDGLSVIPEYATSSIDDDIDEEEEEDDDGDRHSVSSSLSGDTPHSYRLSDMSISRNKDLFDEVCHEMDVTYPLHELSIKRTIELPDTRRRDMLIPLPGELGL